MRDWSTPKTGFSSTFQQWSDSLKLAEHFKQIAVIILIALSAIFLWSFVFGDSGVQNQRRVKRQISQLEKEADSLKEVLKLREDESHRLLTDSFYLETLARTKYGMSQKGETVYQFLD